MVYKTRKKTRWEQRQKGGESDFRFHCLYSGPGCITKDGRENSTKYNFDFQPIDWADAIAKRHDEDYVAATLKGEKYAGFLEDIITVQADEDMVARIRNILVDDIIPFKKLGVGGVNTPLRISMSEEMRLALQGQLNVINALSIYKQWKLTKSTQTNIPMISLVISLRSMIQ